MPNDINPVSIENLRTRVQYVADGIQKYFPFMFRIIKNTDLDVYIDNQKQALNYTVSGAGEPSGGAVVLGEAPSAGAIVTLARNTPVQRTSDFQQSGLFQAKVLNDELDLLTAALQDVADSARRSVKLSVVDSDAVLDLPGKNNRANKLLGFDADGNATVVEFTDDGEHEATPGGADKEVQFNDGGEFGGSTGLIFAKSSNTLSVSGGVRTDTIVEKTSGGGVRVEGVRIKGGLIEGRNISSDGAKLDAVETGADVTDPTSVRAAGAVMNTDTSTVAMQFVVDDDSMVSATNTTVSTSKSVKAYVDGKALSDGNKGDITVSDGASTMTLDNNVVTNAKAADMAQGRIKGRIAAGEGDPQDLTAPQARAIVDVYSRSETEALTWDASTIVSGSFSDERIAGTSITQHEGAIDHDALTNFVANKHIDWTSTTENLSTSGTAATGDLTVTGDIAVSGTVDGRDIAADGAKLDAIDTAGSFAKVATVAAMSALDGAAYPAGSMTFVDNYAAANDAGGGWFEARSSGKAVDNGFVFAHGAGGAMRWHRKGVDDGYCSVAFFGAVGDGMTDDTSAIQAALDSGVSRVVFPPGAYVITSSLIPAAYQIVESVNGWNSVELIANSITGGVIEPNGSYSDPVKDRIQIRGFKITGTCDYGIRLINCSAATVENIRFSFAETGNVSHLHYDCLYLGDSWEARISFILAYVETATITPARSVIWLDGAINGVLADTIRTTAATQYGIFLGNVDSGGAELPTCITINNATLQRQRIGIYAKRCRNVNATGLYFEFTEIPIRLGSDAKSADRCAGFVGTGLFPSNMNGSNYGWADNTTGAIEAIRAYGCTFQGANFADYGSGTPHQMLYVKRCWGLRIDGPTRYNFAMTDMRPAISYAADYDASSTFTITGNGPKGRQTISNGRVIEDGTAAPVAGDHVVGDRVENAAPIAGGVEGWICTAAGSPGVWRAYGQIAN